jgi:hypothetical protein
MIGLLDMKSVNASHELMPEALGAPGQTINGNPSI